MFDKKSKIPSISSDRIDKSVGNTTIGNSKEDQAAHAFVKGKESTQPLTIRLPMPLYNELRELAFKDKTKLNHIVIRSVRDHIRQKNACFQDEK
jgi:hypothetical protein